MKRLLWIIQMGPELPQGSLQEGNQGVPGGPLSRTQHLHCSGPGSVALVRGLKVILQAVGRGQKNKGDLSAVGCDDRSRSLQ